MIATPLLAPAAAGALLRRLSWVALVAFVQPVLAADTETPPAAPAHAPGAAPDPGLAHLTPCPDAAADAAAPRPLLLPVPPATLAVIYDRVKKRLGAAPASICRTPFGLYEVVIDDDVVYVDERVNYLVNGSVFDMRTQENLTAERREDVLRVDFKSLPFELAVKTVHGDGSRVLAVFEDPNCPYCKRFEKDMATLNNATIYTFLYPILSRDPTEPDDSYPKSKAIWCAPDRTAAWSQIMLQGKRLEPAGASCQTPLEDILALGRKLHVSGTPTVIFTDGRRAPGLISLDKMEKMIAEAGASAPKAPQ